MRLSVVIPAYNEERTIGAAIDSLIGEGDAIEEIVVVDNNSTDLTSEIVDKISIEHPKVRRITEPTQGTVAARNTGFNAARGDIIGRIDADTRIKPGWAQAIIDHFADPTVHGASGPYQQYDMPNYRLPVLNAHNVVNDTAEERSHRPARPALNLLGANTAIRAATWQEIRDQTLNRPGIWEDLDIAILLHQTGRKVLHIPAMVVETSGRRLLANPLSYGSYAFGLARIFIARRQWGAVPGAVLNWVVMMGLYWAKFVPARRYDPETGESSWRYFWRTLRSETAPSPI